MFSTNIILDNAIRWALVGAAVGGVGGVIKGFSANNAARRSPQRSSVAALEKPLERPLNPEIAGTVQPLDEFRTHAPQAHSALLRCAGELGALQAALPHLATPPFALSTQAAKHCAGMIEAVRELRAQLVDTRPAVQILEQFDEAAGAVQKLCNDAMHNITLTIQSKK